MNARQVDRISPPLAVMAHLNDLLDEALKQTFPASDPVAIDVTPELTLELTRAFKQGRI